MHQCRDMHPAHPFPVPIQSVHARTHTCTYINTAIFSMIDSHARSCPPTQEKTETKRPRHTHTQHTHTHTCSPKASSTPVSSAHPKHAPATSSGVSTHHVVGGRSSGLAKGKHELLEAWSLGGLVVTGPATAVLGAAAAAAPAAAAAAVDEDGDADGDPVAVGLGDVWGPATCVNTYMWGSLNDAWDPTTCTCTFVYVEGWPIGDVWDLQPVHMHTNCARAHGPRMDM
eukprot:1161999-Pelagomonas_calceolata.AAC.6